MKDVITAQISDHRPVVHDGVLFWNIMMQGTKRNNGFRIEENTESYTKRLIKISHAIAKIVKSNPSIYAITLCEGPIDAASLFVMNGTLKQYPHMEKFMHEDYISLSFHTVAASGYSNWGLLMLADKRFKVVPKAYDFNQDPDLIKKLSNRFQIWELTHLSEKRFIALAHYPFEKHDVRVTEKSDLSSFGQAYVHMVEDIMKKYEHEQFIFCADFNFNPYLINHWKHGELDKIKKNNSILLLTEQVQPVTVDGVLLSKHEKQKYYYSRSNLGLFAKLMRELDLSDRNERRHMFCI